MARKPKASEIAAAFDWDINELRHFAGEVFEDANDHWMAYAMWSMELGDAELACEFLEGEAAHQEAGELTSELQEKRAELLDRFKELQDE